MGAPAVAVARLRLTEFRNYAALDLALAPGAVALMGANGAGKTNLIEAVTALRPGRTLRAAPREALGRRGARAGWAAAAEIATGDGPIRRLGAGVEADGPGGAELRTRYRIDGAPASRASEATRLLPLVWATPAMDRLFVEGAGERRRFLDRFALALDPEHGARAGDYERAMRERNALLRGGGRVDGAWAAALEARMAETGVAIAAARALAAQRLDAAAAWGANAAFPRARARLAGSLEDALAGGAAALDVEDRFRAQLARARARDAAADRALEGPHRSDLEVARAADGIAARELSTGEQKALLIGLILAQARLIGAEAGALPVLLLDEFAAHLDAKRRAALFDEIAALGAQSWLTAAEPHLFKEMRAPAQRFIIEDGAARPA